MSEGAVDGGAASGVAYPDLAGRVVAVFGGVGGIGAAVVAGLQAAGARSVALDLPECDVTDAGAVDAALDAIVQRDGSLYGVVNAAGITRDRSLHQMSDDAWAAVIDVNLSGAFHVLRAAARILRERRAGSIVSLASVNGLRGRFGQSNYSASKAGLIALTRTAARELGPRGVRVNAVAPGMIRTPMTRDLPDAVLELSVGESALGRLGEPEDLVGPILFLLSDQSRYVTGHCLVVDGGQIA